MSRSSRRLLPSALPRDHRRAGRLLIATSIASEKRVESELIADLQVERAAGKPAAVQARCGELEHGGPISTEARVIVVLPDNGRGGVLIEGTAREFLDGIEADPADDRGGTRPSRTATGG